MVGGTIPPQRDSGEIYRVLVLNLLSRKSGAHAPSRIFLSSQRLHSYRGAASRGVARSDDLFCRARIIGNGTAPPVHSMGGVRSPLDPSPTAVALAASCLARLGYRGGNPALGLPADPTGKLAAGTCWGHRLS